MSQAELVSSWRILNRGGGFDLLKARAEKPEGIENHLVIAKGKIAGIEMFGEISEVENVLSRILDNEVQILKLVRPYLHDPKKPILVDLEDLYTSIAGLRVSDTNG